MAVAVFFGLTLRLALKTGLIAKGRYWTGKWSRSKNPIKYSLTWIMGGFAAIGLFAIGACLCAFAWILGLAS
jgi:hypothetical protein